MRDRRLGEESKRDPENCEPGRVAIDLVRFRVRWGIEREAGKKARRWVVERTQSWMNRFRAILIRWEKKPANYLGWVHLVCALITFRCLALPG